MSFCLCMCNECVSPAPKWVDERCPPPLVGPFWYQAYNEIMNRDPGGELIFFNDEDRGRCPDLNLEPWLPVEAAAGLHEKLSLAFLAASDEKDELEAQDVMDTPQPELQHRYASVNRRLYDLSKLKGQLFRLAPDEITATMPLEVVLPGIAFDPADN